MKVFISWSGDRSREVAFALKDWLPLVLQYAEPWVSEKDIDAGERWAQSVAGELEASNFGIICLTPENLGKEWLLFEAGALSKSLLDARVVPVLFDLDFKDITGPLSQFQAKKLEKEGIRDVVKAINDVAPSGADDVIWSRLVDSLWDQLEKSLPTQGLVKSKPSSADISEILESLVSTVRSFDARLARPRDDAKLEGAKEQRYISQDISFVREFGASVGSGGDPYLGLLLYSGLLNEAFPWLSELLRFIHSGLVSNDEHRFNQSSAALKKVSAAVNNPEISMKLLELGSKRERKLISEVAPRLVEYLDMVSLMGFVRR